MTLLMIEGFDDNVAASKGWSGGNLATSATGGRFGGGYGSCNSMFSMVTRTFSAVTSGSVFVGVAIRLNPGSTFPGGSGSERLFVVGPVAIHAMETAAVGVYRSDTNAQVALSATNLWQAGVWRYIEVKYTLATGACTVRMDTNTIVTTTLPTAASVSSFVMGPNNAYDTAIYNGTIAYFDDIYVLSDAGTTNNTFLGDVRVQTLLPSADGSNSGMTPDAGTTHYSRVNEATPDTTTYVSTPNTGVKDSYKYQQLATNTSSVYGVAVTSYVSKDAPGTASIASLVRMSSTDYVNAMPQALSASWTAVTDLYNARPSDSGVWTTTDVNNAEFGVQTS